MAGVRYLRVFRVLLVLTVFLTLGGAATVAATSPQDDFLAKEAAAVLAHMDGSFRSLSIKLNEPDMFQPATQFTTKAVKGISITLDPGQILSVKFRTCELGGGTVVNGSTGTVSVSACEGSKGWKDVDESQKLAAIHPETIQVKKVDPPSGASWFRVFFKQDMDDRDYGDIYCAGEEQCRTMADDLHTLYALAVPLPSPPQDIGFLLIRLNAFVKDLAFHQRKTIQGKAFEVGRTVDGIGVNKDKSQLLMQDRVCAVPAGQACGPDSWLVRRSLVVVAGLAPEASVDQSYWLSDDGKIGAVVLSCASGKTCIAQKSRADSEPQALSSIEIPCAVDGGCAETKAEIEELVNTMHSLGH